MRHNCTHSFCNKLLKTQHILTILFKYIYFYYHLPVTQCVTTAMQQVVVGWKPILFSLYLDSFRNKSGKPQPIWTKVGTHAQVKGRQRSRTLERDRLSGGEMGAKKCPLTPGFFCQQYHTTFRQLRNGRFSPNFAATRESWVKRRFWTKNYEKFHFRGHLPPKPQTWRGQTGTSLRAGYRLRDALQRDTVYSTL